MYSKIDNRAINPSDHKVEVALHQARIIQQQKKLEARIVESIEELLELPRSIEADPRAPSIPDAHQFLSLVSIFQSNHYDDLVEERQAAGLCGYVLCPRPPRRLNTDYKIIKGHGKGEMNVVHKHEIERWCSDDCGRRALHVQAQLDEEPAWARAAGKNISIALMDISRKSICFGSTSSKAHETNEILTHRQLNSVTKSMADLAFERGDSETPWTSRKTVKGTIQERFDNNGQLALP